MAKVETTIALLPDGQWPPAGGQGAIRFQDQKVFENLVRAEVLDARGVSNPWSAALGFAWRLELKDPSADELLFLLLLARYLDAVSVRTVSLKADGSLLQRVLWESADLGSPQLQVTVFEWRDPPAGSPGVLAGGIWPAWTIFPSAHYQTSEGARVLRDHLLQANESLLMPAAGAIAFKDEAEDLAFRRQLAALAIRARQVTPDGPWHGRLLTLARHAIPAPGGETDALIHTRVSGGEGELWMCPDHTQVPWARDPQVKQFTVAEHSGEILCTVHNTPLQRRGQNLRLEDIGAAWLRNELVVWEDAKRDDNLRLLPATGDTVTLQYANGPTFSARARVISLSDVLCAPSALQGGEFAMALPIRVAYLDLLKEYEWLPSQGRWKVSFRGRGSADVLDRQPVGDTGLETGFVIWPAERPGGWRSDVVIARHQFADETTLVERLADGSRKVTASRRNAVLLAEPKEGIAEFVALQQGGNERGVVPLRNAESAESDRGLHGYLAIDFGTSNSLIQMAVGQGEGWFARQGVSSVSEACWVPVKNRSFTSGLASSLDVFHGTYESANPSPLLGTLLLRKRPPDASETQWSVIPRDPGLVKNYRKAPGTELLANLKWQDLDGFDSEAVRVYLQRVLLPVFLELRTRGVSTVAAAVTYPLAFESMRRQRLSKAVDEALQWLSERTAISLVPGSATVISESRAGIRAVPAAGSDYSITLDMGGGTTDIAVMDRTGRVLVADSLQVGARRLLALFAARQRNLAQNLARGFGAEGQALGVTLETLIETVLQARGINGLKEFISQDTDLARRRALAAVLAGVIVVTRRLLCCATRTRGESGKPSANVYLLGQGWGLLDAELTYGFSEASFLDALKESCADDFDLVAQSAGKTSFDRKKLVVEGALQLLRAGGVEPELVPVSYLGMDLRIDENGQSRVLEARERLGNPIGRLANGDPGFGTVIDELVAVMPRATSPEFPLVECGRWLDETEGPARKTRRQKLIDLGWHELQTLAPENGAGLRSPLVSFVSRSWTKFWVDSVTSAG